METVETVEIVLENGEYYEFKASKCSVVLGDITEKVSNLGGRIFKTKIANDVDIILSNKNDIEVVTDLIEQKNILEVVLIDHLKNSEKYLVKWGESDIDENSLQRTHVTTSHGWMITIKEQ